VESCADSCCRSTPSALSLTSERAALIRQAFRLEWMTVAWMVVEGVVALGAGLAAGSLTLMAFGLDSAIELASAGVLIWRLNVELRHGQGFSERAERTASRIGAVLLFTLAAYIVGGAAWSLWTRHGEAFSLPGLIVALLAMPIMTLLARDCNAARQPRHAHSLAKGFGNLQEQGVKRAYTIFNNCYQNFGIMNATTMAAILHGPEQ
jgi:hypothetical protein